ncbi:uncharacterized protein LOC106773465 [Vigna radiata var. radiata]|uniref:Uncharacterized protein LOC106773465 n=1 Tax=Vigna radiata var. radiata TaxID=3916 RepID=A0A1S3VBB1_VIGRR|nr:uncharacterized protein LOC106773465 [Vigna radiata var. radiata]
MAGEGGPRRTLADASNVIGPQSFNSIAMPRDNTLNMVMNPVLIHLVQSNQFHGLSNESPYDHLTTFNEICNTVKINGLPDDRIKLNLFPFSLGSNSKLWLNSFPEGTFTTWEVVVNKFLSKYFPQSKINKGKMEISSFRQGMEETLDAVARGNIKIKTADEAYKLPEDMAVNENETLNERGVIAQKRGVLQLPTKDALLAQNKLLSQQLDNLSKIIAQLPKEMRNVSQAQQPLCDFCGGDHVNGQCAFPEEAQEEANYMGNQF